MGNCVVNIWGMQRFKARCMCVAQYIMFHCIILGKVHCTYNIINTIILWNILSGTFYSNTKSNQSLLQTVLKDLHCLSLLPFARFPSRCRLEWWISRWCRPGKFSDLHRCWPGVAEIGFRSSASLGEDGSSYATSQLFPSTLRPIVCYHSKLN